MHCPESAWLEPLYPDYEGIEAREGIAAHEMGECVLTNIISLPEELVDRTANNGFVYTPEMVPAVELYVEHVRSHGGGYWVEESIRLEYPGIMHDVINGRCDGSAFNFNEQSQVLRINEFKYGRSPVEVFENWQLLIEAVGVWRKINRPITSVEMTIIQPRGYHHDGPIRTWSITGEQLVVYEQKIIEGKNTVHSENRQCISGSWCRWCKVLAFCPTAKAASMNAVDVVMAALPDTDTPEQIALLMDTLTHAASTVKHTLDAINARAEAMIKNGQPIPGYAYEPGVGKRRFTNYDTALAVATVMNVDITKNTTVTPLEAERRGLSKTVVAQLTTTPSTAPRLIKRDASQQVNKDFRNG